MREALQNYHLSTDLATQEELDNAISSVNSISSDILDGLSNVINGKLSAIADLVEEETKKLDELSTKVDSGSGGGGSSISDYISAITINGTTKTPVDKVVDLGAISSYVSDLSTVYASVSSVQELSSTLGNILSALQEINGTGNGGSGGYSGFIPTSDPLYYKVTKDGISISRQIQGPPLSWFQSNTDTESSYSDNGTFKFTFDGNGNIIVTVDSNIGSIYSGTAPYSLGDTVATIDQTTLIPTSINGTFEWIESL